MFQDDKAFTSPSAFCRNSQQRPSTMENRSCQTSPQMSPLRSFHQSELSLDALYENVRSTTPVHAVSDTNGFAFSDVLSDADSEMQACSLPEIHSREHCREKKFGMDEYEERYASSVGASYPASVEPSQDPWYPSTVQIEPDRYDPRVPNECLGCMQNPQAVYQLPSRFPQASQSFIPSYSQSYHPIPPGVPQSTPQRYQDDQPPPGFPQITPPSSHPSAMFMNETNVYSPYVVSISPSSPPYGSQWTNESDSYYHYPPQAYSRGTYSPVENRGIHKEGPPGANLFIYHLPVSVTDADLKTLFTACGHIVSAKVYIDKQTGKSKGFGFVSYDSVLSARLAIETMNGFKVDNKILRVRV